MPGNRPVYANQNSAHPYGWEEDKLDRALIAGLILEVILDNPGFGTNASNPRYRVKNRVQEALLLNLAGRVTLDRFRALSGKLERWFSFYYPLISPNTFPPESRKVKPAAASPAHQAIREDRLEEWLYHHAELLPHRRHRKLDSLGLKEFLRSTQGRNFRVKDFQRHFKIDGKTAWEYLNLLRQVCLLAHNRGQSAAARYFLDSYFLRVNAAALRQKISVDLEDIPPALASQVADCLIASGGEAFWDNECRTFQDFRQEVILNLQACGLLEVVSQSGESRLLRLPPRWLH